MWFDEIMDDCKQALLIVNKYKGVFIPIFFKLALTILIGIFVLVSLFTTIYRHEYVIEYIFTDYYALFEVLPTILFNGVIIYLLILFGYSMIDVGSINVFKAALTDTRPRFKDFWEGIKKYLFKVVLGKLLLHVIVLLLSPILLALYFLYAVVVGTLTAGWGLIVLGICISIYLGTWITIVVVEGNSPLKAIGKSIRLGKRYFKGLFIVLLAASMIGSYFTTLFGFLAALLGGWFLAGVAASYFKMVVMLIYYRNKESI